MAIVGEVRSKGLYAGIEFVADKEKKTPFPREQRVQEQVVSLAFDRGVIISSGSGGIVNGLCGDDIGMGPPFVIERGEIDQLVNVLGDCIMNVSKKLGS
jgi:adenosylmethionine-8-amino-7-oxononanoate aminotransferase